MKNITLVAVAIALFGFIGSAYSLQQAWENVKQTGQTAVQKTKEALGLEESKYYTRTGTITNDRQCEQLYQELEAQFNAAKARGDYATLSSIDNKVANFFENNPHCKTAQFPSSGKIQSLQTRVKAEVSGAKSNFR